MTSEGIYFVLESQIQRRFLKSVKSRRLLQILSLVAISSQTYPFVSTVHSCGRIDTSVNSRKFT